MLKELLASTSIELWGTFWIILAAFILMWYKGKLPSTGALQDLTTILNSRGGNILILAAASVYFFYRAEHMYVIVMDLVNNNKMTADNGIALNGLTFDTGAFGAAFGALLKTMSPDAPSPASSTSTGTTSTTTVVTQPPNPPVQENNPPSPLGTQGNTTVQSEIKPLQPVSATVKLSTPVKPVTGV